MHITHNALAAEISEKSDLLQSQKEALPQLNDDNIGLILNSAKVEVDEDIEVNPTCITILQKGSKYIWGTLSNFSVIIGKAKSRKSFVIIIVIAAAIKKILFDFISVTFLPGKNKVLFFDTEQSRYHVQRAIKRICSLAGTSYPESLTAYGLRRFTPAERLKLIEYAIYNTEGVGLVVIDGIRDLITSINDEEQATMITSKLLKWTEERNIHIIVVLHQNKGDANARGFVGTEMTNKAESMLSVSKDSDNKNISIVQSEYCRDKDFEPFAFQIDEQGLPFLDEDYMSKSDGGRKAFTHTDIPKETHLKVLDEVFAFNPTPKYRELISQLQVYFGKHDISIGETKVKNFITYYQNEKMIVKDEKLQRYPIYQRFTGSG